MQRILLVAALAVLAGAAVAPAEDSKPVQPPAPPKVAPAIQPAQPRVVAVSPARMLQLEEDVEVLEAQREVKRGHVKVAEVNIRAAELGMERLKKAVANGIVSKEEFDRAALELETAKLQVEIRTAELKEVEVKLKFAKKRLEDAKAAGVRPAPAP